MAARNRAARKEVFTVPLSLSLRMPISAIALCAVATLGLTACSGDDTKSASQAEAGPLSKYLESLWDAEAYTQEKFDADQKKTEELIAQCMTKLGFEYTPNTSDGGGGYISADDATDWGSKEFVTQYGYGIVNSPGMSEAAPEDPGSYIDPNADYLSALSESELAAYNEALWGPAVTDVSFTGDMSEAEPVAYDWTQSGCQGAADHEVREAHSQAESAAEDPAFTELFTEIDAFYAQFYGDQPAVSAIADLDILWNDCMITAGYSEFTSPTSTIQQLLTEYQDALVPPGSEGEPSEPSEPSPKVRQEFSERELAVALADYECRERLNYEDQLTKIMHSLEQQFVDTHQQQLEALVATYGISKQK